jgi:hypothetical protein
MLYIFLMELDMSEIQCISVIGKWYPNYPIIGDNLKPGLGALFRSSALQNESYDNSGYGSKRFFHFNDVLFSMVFAQNVSYLMMSWNLQFVLLIQ